MCVFPQSPFNDIKYELVGDAMALQFFVVNQNGGIYQRKAVQYEVTKAKEYKVKDMSSSNLTQVFVTLSWDT